MGGIEAASTVLALGSSDGKSGFGRGRDILRHLDWDFFIFYFDFVIYAILSAVLSLAAIIVIRKKSTR